MGIFSCLETYGENPYVPTSNNMSEDREAQKMLYENGLCEDKKRKKKTIKCFCVR